jgi:hypothetical protein
MTQKLFDWLRENPGEELPATQATTLETVYRDYINAVYAAGGDEATASKSFEVITQQIFDCRVNELFQATDTPPGEFHKLPNVVQKAYITALFTAECAIRKSQRD